MCAESVGSGSGSAVGSGSGSGNAFGSVSISFSFEESSGTGSAPFCIMVDTFNADSISADMVAPRKNSLSPACCNIVTTARARP